MWRYSKIVLFLSVAQICILLTRAEGDHHKHVVYHGLIKEDAREGDEVWLDKPLMVRDPNGLVGDEICSYTIYKSSEIPFQVELDQPHSTTGKARIVLATGFKLNYEGKSRYTFEIAARDCAESQHARREKVHVEVEDVNEYPPTWEEPSYYAEIREGITVEEVVKVEATDEDGSDDFGSICLYNIITPDVPFKISKEGVVSNTEPLDFSHNHNFVLEVKAEDCGGSESRTSEKVMVSVKVLEKCKTGWRGFDDRIEFTPGSSVKRLAEDAKFEQCDNTCKEKSISTKITLSTDYIGKRCDRDTYSIQSQRKLCGASTGSIDLLPSTSFGLWSQNLPTDDGRESDQIFSFDGKTNAVEVPEKLLDHSLQKHFTVSMWMKHEENPDDSNEKGTKEHILCNADGEKMNRHHYSLFVHNCKLVLLIRQEPLEGVDLNKFKPAEWRWKMAEVCDNEWHHYAVNIDIQDTIQVNLYVDGNMMVTNDDNLEIIDDWPLHPSHKVHFTKLVVGACWMGGEGHLTEYFRGYLADLSILNGKTESARVIQCLNNCKEQLDFHAMNEMEAGMEVAFNSEMTDITISGKIALEVEKLVQRVGYTNSRRFPTPGARSLTIHTELTCEDGSKPQIPDLQTMIMVLQIEKPIISIYGTENLARSEEAVANGLKIFHDINIYSRTQKEEEEMKASEQDTQYNTDKNDDRYKLDSCTITVQPPMNVNFEELRYPEHLLEQLSMVAYESETGLIISGVDIISQYEQVLRALLYVNNRPEDMNSRIFKLYCSELNGRFTSNELAVRLDVIHVDHHEESQKSPQHAQVSNQHVKSAAQVKSVSDIHLQKDNLFKNAATTGTTGVGMIVIIVVCVGFLLFMIVLGVIRIRSAHQRTQEVRDVEEKQEMEWDNSALTITVNPMDQENAYGEEHELNGMRADESDSDDDDGSDYHDDIESSEEEAEKVKDRDLEWDDSTLTF